MKNEICLGIDVGSTTVKLALMNPENRELIYSRYQRHNADQAGTVLQMLRDLRQSFPNIIIQPIFCGSGATGLAKKMNAPFVQEVVANALAVREFYPDARCAIELGGQDAKVIFFHRDEETGQLLTSDMRMNGSCAGGTGAFIDQIAELLHVSPDEFGSLAEAADAVYDISGRCGVFAKTDIQPLLNQGVSRENLALSAFHAIAKQTIGGLAQGMEFHPKVIFEGGPLTFLPRLVKVFQERLNLGDDECILPEHPETLVAHGAALAWGRLFDADSNKAPFDIDAAIEQLAEHLQDKEDNLETSTKPFFSSQQEKQAFLDRHATPEWQLPDVQGQVGYYLGLDGGSTTTKFVFLDEQGNMLYRWYGNNQGDPLGVFIKAYTEALQDLRDHGIEPVLLGAGATGYGEMLFARGFSFDYHVVETVAHARAAREYQPDVSYVLDIGGQDMKAIQLNGGIVTGIVLNEACSAGCGSFVESYARSLQIPVAEVASRAFEARQPSVLGSRCTVFMNSSIITEQKNGKTTEDILAGICRSIVENVFTKVLRVHNPQDLGEHVVVQGGTFRNDAVLRAFEQYIGREVTRPPYPGEMGAIGIALLTREHMLSHGQNGQPATSQFISEKNLQDFSYEKKSGIICPLCANACMRSAVIFSNGRQYVTGNRCERGEVISDADASPSLEAAAGAAPAKADKVPPATDLMELREKLLFQNYPLARKPIRPASSQEKSKIRVGIPRALEFWDSMPFWRSFFLSLGCEPVISARSSQKLFERGLSQVASDTVCFPAKLSHGHILDLIDKKVDRIFNPMFNRMPSENASAKSFHVCAVVKGYPMVLRYNTQPEERYGIPYDTPLFYWMDERTRDLQVIRHFSEEWDFSPDEIRLALENAKEAQRAFRDALHNAGTELLKQLQRDGGFAVVIAGRPYHSDPLVNHHVSRFFTRQGISVMTLDSLPNLDQESLQHVRMETTINFHVRLLAGASFVARHPNLELVNLVSFGCGHDAVLTDEVARIMQNRGGKEPLVLKLDESDITGPLSIRIKSFVETLNIRRAQANNNQQSSGKKNRKLPFPDPFPVKFTKKDRKTRTILVPNITESFAHIASSAIRKEGFRVEPLPFGGPKTAQLGKKFVHNDMCYPAQINIGEFLAAMENGRWDAENVALGLAKDHCDCRLAQYATVARRALDAAGYSQVPIITTGEDTKDMHPDFSLSPLFQYRMLWGLAGLDILEALRRKIRPYEKVKGNTDEVFYTWVHRLAAAMDVSLRKYRKEFVKALEAFNQIPADRSEQRPKVFVIGEFLLNFHPESNNNIERYLEDHGMEVIMPNVLYVFHREYLREESETKEFGVRYGFLKTLVSRVSERVFRQVIRKTQQAAKICPIYHAPGDFRQLSDKASHIIHKTFTSGEGWMIAAEILEYAEQGVDSFLILQPFGCLPNHVTGRGLVKRIKQEMPHIQILALDYDPDTSLANIENRLQMLILTARERHAAKNALATDEANRAINEPTAAPQTSI
ncbi:MAG: activase [Spirochaetaceae bacterium]|nr:MAG: activase [Spirochaetaceae bacterium]